MLALLCQWVYVLLPQSYGVVGVLVLWLGSEVFPQMRFTQTGLQVYWGSRRTQLLLLLLLFIRVCLCCVLLMLCAACTTPPGVAQTWGSLIVLVTHNSGSIFLCTGPNDAWLWQRLGGRIC